MTNGRTRTIRVCVAGATGWAGSAVAMGVIRAPDMTLASAVARSAAGGGVDAMLGEEAAGVQVAASVSDALHDVDVLVDYTTHSAVRSNVAAAIEAGVAVVVGSSGLSGAEYKEIDASAREAGVGVIAAGNFSLTAAMAQAAATLVAPHLPQSEVIDYASEAKADAPSGTARELAERLAAARPPVLGRERDQISGHPEARGAEIEGVPVHSVRLPGFSVSTEVVFGLPDERLTIRHDAGMSAAPYVAGTLIAIRRAGNRIGLTRGLDSLLLDVSAR